MLRKVVKRDGRVVDFDAGRIRGAIYRAFCACGQDDINLAQDLASQVVSRLEVLHDSRAPSVEEIQDVVEETLASGGHFAVAKRYILYRKQHEEMRSFEKLLVNAGEMMDTYLGRSDWRVQENSNMEYSLQGLNNHVVSSVTAEYWLQKIYPPEVRRAHLEGDLHIHDLNLLAPYCCGWDLPDLLLRGFGGIPHKVESAPARHFRVALGQIVNFVYTLQGEAAGAQAFSGFDTYLAPFVAFDGLGYQEVRQCLQEFVHNLNIPTRVGFQTPFVNITLDVRIPKTVAGHPAIVGGQYQDRCYGDFQAEADLINLALCDVLLAGDAKGRTFSFPIPTYNIGLDFPWGSLLARRIMQMTAKYGVPYFSNFVNSDLSPEDVRSMCCRLRLDNRQLLHRGGGLFGSNPLTGSIGVITVNLARIGYLTRTRETFLQRLKSMMDLARQSLMVKRRLLETLTDGGLYPYSRVYLSAVKQRFGEYWHNHFNTIGIVGMHEALLNLLGSGIDTTQGQAFAAETLDFMRDVLVQYQEDTGYLFNLEATPAEGASYRLARTDRQAFPDIITSGDREPYYTNSTQLPVGFTDDLFTALDMQEDLQTRYTGGTVFHAFLGEQVDDLDALAALIQRVFTRYRIPYLTITPTFSICPEHGYISGERHECPACGAKTEVWSRVVGFYRPVSNWNKGKQQEFSDRLEYDLQVPLTAS